MALTESTRELILQNVVATLEGIDGEEPYWNEVKSVKRVPTMPTDLEGEEKPGILVSATGEPERIENQKSWHDRRDLRVGVVGIMDSPADDTGTAVNRFMKDVGIAMMADVTRGGKATMTFRTYQTDLSNLFGDLCIFEMEFSIIYHCDGRLE